MSNDNKATKAVRAAKNIIYSVLVLIATFGIGIAILDPSAINNASSEPKLSAGSLVAFGLSVIVTIIFSIWLSKRQK